ncbi:IQ-DOMAIN 31-like protein, partial [Tanacetum coccineum]
MVMDLDHTRLPRPLYQQLQKVDGALEDHITRKKYWSIDAGRMMQFCLHTIHQQNHQTIRKAAATTKACYRVSHTDAMAAATKIQAAFRSYLAQKDLCALHGLVKLQALVRGHLVQKRTTTMVTYMSALVAIQVRARFQRIQMAEDGESRTHAGSSTSKRGFMMAQERSLSAPQLDHIERMREFRSKGNTSISYRQSSQRFLIDSSPSKHEKSIGLQIKQMDEVSTTSQT